MSIHNLQDFLCKFKTLQAVTQKYPQFPTALSSDLPHSDKTQAFILYGTTLNLAKLLEFQQKCGQSFCVLMHGNVEKNTVVLLKGKWLADFYCPCSRPAIRHRQTGF